jgi:hypothetical protein
MWQRIHVSMESIIALRGEAKITPGWYYGKAINM